MVGIGIGAFFLVGLVAGLRVLRLWLHDRQLPELMAAITLLAGGPLGVCVMLLGARAVPEGSLQTAVIYLGLSVLNLGFLTAGVFTWRVFRPDERWAHNAIVCFAFGFAASVVGGWWEGSVPLRNAPGPWAHLSLSLKTLVMAWGSAESLLYWTRARRRIALGLIDPLVSNRFFLWGLSLGCVAMAVATAHATMVVEGAMSDELVIFIQVLVSICGSLAAAALYAAFLPPQRYASWVRTRAGRVAAAAA